MLHVNLTHSIFHLLNLQHIQPNTENSGSKSTFPFHSKKSKPCGKDHSLSSLWFDISFYYFLPPGSLHCDGRRTWRGNTGTKWPSSASMAKAQSRAVAAVKVMMQWKPFPSYPCAFRPLWNNLRAALLCPRPLTCHLNSDCETRLVQNWNPLLMPQPRS